MKTNYDSMDEAFEALVNFVNEHEEDTTDVPDLFFTARPSHKVAHYEIEE